MVIQFGGKDTKGWEVEQGCPGKPAACVFLKSLLLQKVYGMITVCH